MFRNADRTAIDLSASLHQLRYRGPDEAGAVGGNGWSIGASRLRIVGLENGSQPFIGTRGTVCAFNGEIYNHRELRALLQDEGVILRTDSDGEVIVHLYERYGLRFTHLLRGMFACAVYEPSTRRLVLARDRIGKKPLFYFHQPGHRAVFGSTINAVLADDTVPRRIDPDAIDYFLSYRIIPAPLTIYRDVRKVEPGCMMVFDAAGGRQCRYWLFPQRETRQPESEDSAVHELRELLAAAVETRIPTEVPSGVFLSGGLDSSLVTALYQRRQREPVRSFSIGFAHSAFDERPFAREVARALGTDHHEHEITPAEALAAVHDLTWHFGEPFAFPSSIACYCMSRLASKHCRVILGGDGADELFAGYNRYKKVIALTGRDPASCDDEDNTPEAIARDYEPILIDGLRTEWKHDLLSRRFADQIGPIHGGNRLVPRVRDVRKVEFLNRLLALDTRFWLTDAQLCKVDVASMSHSLEVRHPLLDESIVDFASRLPSGYKLRHGKKSICCDAPPNPICRIGHSGARNRNWPCPSRRGSPDIFVLMSYTRSPRRARWSGAISTRTNSALSSPVLALTSATRSGPFIPSSYGICGVTIRGFSSVAAVTQDAHDDP